MTTSEIYDAVDKTVDASVAAGIAGAVQAAEERAEAAEQTVAALADAAIFGAMERRIDDLARTYTEGMDKWRAEINGLREISERALALATETNSKVVELLSDLLSEEMEDQPSIQPQLTSTPTPPQSMNPAHESAVVDVQEVAPRKRRML